MTDPAAARCPRPVTAVAHRGDPYRARENTAASIRSALARGADAVEVDVRLTRDGVPVLLHDDTLKRLWRVDRPLAALTLADVRELTGPQGVPTLREALEAAGPHRVMIDLPGPPPGPCAPWSAPSATAAPPTASTTAPARPRCCWCGPRTRRPSWR